ncbi:MULTISPECIES: SDR family oxidoreductase [Pseudovibrio]|uniref:SDR family oxidoreductase n=1 Tax=Stappiaceae TaxID=2821832 RepID=UPI00236544CD|nr:MULTISPECIES: SDR family oxidoreductase [Pseudovibrio]MDD7910081.1 SDR family oxidoreductase [Pseudovibrio exalbescens]MDX5592364.1 SDR family oxidoreductase [Pseudovibrio sp. SPO723]
MSLGSVVITGASRGIGAATAVLAAKRGFSVCVNYTSNEEAADQVLAKVTENGGMAIKVQADVSREDEVARMFDRCEQELGHLSGLVNSAGIMSPNMRLETMDFARLERVFRINVLGSILCAKEAVRRMSRTNGGHGGAIVNLSSVASQHGAPGENVDYAASKGAIDSFTKGLAKEVAADGIRVNCVRPGLTATELHESTGDPERIVNLAPYVPIKRVAEPHEIAEAIMWFLSDQSSYCVGAILDVSGGR